jgi:hypothetical protein
LVKRKRLRQNSPKSKIYSSTDPEGSDSYLKDEQAALAQVSGPDAEALGEVGNNARALEEMSLAP